MAERKYMAQALQEARKAALRDEVPVGAVIVVPDSGKVIARAHNRSEYGADPSAHAEILAIRKACRKLSLKRLWQMDMYVTLEPRTMCAAAISFARIRRLIVGAPDAKGGAVISGVKFYEQPSCHHRPEIISGISEEECLQILKDFFKNKRCGGTKSACSGKPESATDKIRQ